MSPLNDLDLDLSPVEGHRFTCIDGCELCCLCQPEVMPQEVSFFRERFPERLIMVDDAYQHLALATREGGGPCSFLVRGRCEIYDHRPRFCRQFPFHLYMGERVQAEVDLSCRGVWVDRGERASPIVERMVQESQEELSELLVETRSYYCLFWENCRIAGVEHDIDALKTDLEANIQKMDLTFLARLLESSTDDSEMGPPIEGGASLDRGEMADLEEAVMESALSSLESDSPYEAPVYCDLEGRWNLFEVRGGEVHWQVMDREGDMQYIAPIDPAEIRIAGTGLVDTDAFRDYLRTLIHRDSFWGQAFYLEDMYGYEDHLSNTCLGTFANTVLDLLWRTSLLGNAMDIEAGEELMREGLIFYDMDRLGAPTIGAFF